jgi:hypothetical protein
MFLPFLEESALSVKMTPVYLKEQIRPWSITMVNTSAQVF